MLLDAPALMFNGKVAPVIEYAAPLTAAAVTFKVAEPGFEMVSVRVAVVLTVMLPKLIDAGETPICATGFEVAEPTTETVVGELLALLMKDSVPLALPAVVGE